MDPEKESNAIKVYIPSELLEKEDKEYNKSVFVGWKAEKNQLFIVNAYEDRKAERLNSVLNSINKGAKLRNITYMKNGLELVKEFKFEKNTDNKERLQIILKDGKTGDRIRNVIVFVYNNKSFDFKATNLYENMNIQDEIVSETSHLNSDVGSCAILCTTLKNYIDKHMDSVKVELKEEMSLSYMSSYDRRTDVVALCKYYSYQFLMKMTFYLSMMALYTLRVLKCATKFIKFMENKLNFVSIIMSKLRTISLWHKLYEELVNKKEIGEYIAVSTELNDVAVSFYLDLFLGIIYLVWFREVFMEKLFVLRSYLKTKYIEKLKSLFYISTAKVFIHIKLNNEVSTSLSKFIINKVIMWNYVSTYLRPVNVFLFKGMHFMSIFGVSALLSFILDVFTFETRHLYYLYFVILALMNYCHKYLYSLIQMFKGKKWNTLKSELDTNQFTKEHLFIGVVFFIVFTLNYPTIWIFYISIITILMPVLVTKALMDAFIDVVYDFPYYFIIHNTFNSVKYTKGVYFKHMYSKWKVEDIKSIESSEEVNKDGTLDYLYLEVMPNKIPLRERNSRIRKKLGEKLDRVSPIKVISKKEGIFLSLNCIDIKMRFMYADDLHSHLRQGEMMKKVVKYVRRGGCNRVLVMPNTMPEITSCSQALEYRNELMELEPKVDYLMTLYLSDKVSTDDLRNNAKSCHVQGVKCYPANVTTNSNMGFNTLEPYYPLFREMERLNLSLHIHGEAPDCSPLIAEKEFLTNIENVCRSFPSLKVVMEHVTMEPSLDLVKRTNNLGATVTPHHMVLTVSDVLETTESITLDNVVSHVKDPFAYCKPLAKWEEDREAILEILKAGHPRVFLGSDSAPHTIQNKKSPNPPAGVYTQPFLLQYLSDTFESKGFLNKLENFCCKNGQDFLGLPPKEPEYFELVKQEFTIPEEVEGVRPFLAGKTLNYRIVQ